jgi:hypothetical protein
MALAACGLIACNQWSGFFSTDKPGQSRVDGPADGILRDHPYYYFHLPPSSESGSAGRASSDPPSSPPPYPIVPRFSDWSFPHHDLPAHWTRLQLQTNPNIQPMVVGQRASFCVATNYSHGVDVAHCVPSNEREWWDLNRMDRYARPSALLFSTQPQDSPANLVPLRSDFHRVLDKRHLCFVPKEVEGSDSSSSSSSSGGDPPPVQIRLLIHVVVPSPNGQVAGLWHNRALHALPPGLSKECLFARFAYTILSPSVFCSAFLSGATEARRLCTRDPETQIPGVRMEGPADCRRSCALLGLGVRGSGVRLLPGMATMTGVVRGRLGSSGLGGRRRRRKSKGVMMMLQVAVMGALVTAGIMKSRHPPTSPCLGYWLSLDRILPMRKKGRRGRNEGVAGSEPSRSSSRLRGGKYMVCGCQSFDARCGKKPDYLDDNVTYIIILYTSDCLFTTL